MKEQFKSIGEVLFFITYAFMQPLGWLLLVGDDLARALGLR